jgi:replication-associated recombination protein RarA
MVSYVFQFVNRKQQKFTSCPKIGDVSLDEWGSVCYIVLEQTFTYFGGVGMYQPLADLLRPTTLDEVYGQEHILGKGGILRRLVDSGNIPNMVFYGPSGTGKTTVANIIAKQTNRTLYKLNATTASTADIKQIVAELDTFMAPNGILLYLDEIQSFNRKQQQSL